MNRSTRTIDPAPLVFLVLLTACGAAPDKAVSVHADDNSVPEPAREPFPQEGDNPFLSPSPVNAEQEDLSRCASLRLQIPNLTAVDVLHGELEVANDCSFSVAVLTSPVETRERFAEESRFPAEIGISEIYAVAYVFRQEVGLGKDAFRGDGGVVVTSAPGYAVVGAGENRSIPLTSGMKLAHGSYGLALFTIVAPTVSIGPGANHIDLRKTVAASASTPPLGQRLLLAESAVRLAPVAFFEVEPQQ